ncbi:T9SS C-terminal target domain-containing protein [Flavobacterium circumlabens]|uniref:Secreted protein (Por secretion system target) n=1 Tax=Flavobacterium circumlabens TaxID=2133765 RepID=A0A4Y7UEM2_9FLAO|nr:PA14 domain-containing protein [Flavobacterium circumlabens]TCN59534.1 putative secreted protein (Por secretion system target) [Flavobacterium circumlabens]TEB44826.1 T9SS C-terminal target domain-containing protein [Flavobacterium circumlabens]
MNNKSKLLRRIDYRSKIGTIFFLFIMPFISFQIQAQDLIVPPNPGSLSSVEGLSQSGDYKVEVKKAGDANYTECFVYKTINSWTYSSVFAAKSQKSASFTNISFSNTAIDVRITTNFTANNVTIRPLNFGINGIRNGNVITFRLTKPTKISIEVNNRLNPLFLFADTPDVVPLASETTYFYGPGIHKIGLAKQLKTNDKVYIAAGAVVEGSFLIPWNSKNVSVKGRGILTMGKWKHTTTDLSVLGQYCAVKANGVSNLQMEGIIIANSAAWTLSIYNSDNLTHDNQYRNLKMVNWNGNTDGIWINGDNNIVDDCFIFNNDDAIMSHGSTNSKISNLVVWGGPWGRLLWLPSFVATSGFTMENINVIGKDGGEPLILIEREKDISGVNLKNIRVEQRNNNEFLEVKNTKNGKVKNWKFTDVTLDDQKNIEGSILGNATGGTVDDITFSNLKMGGNFITTLIESKMTKNDYATNIKFDNGTIAAPSELTPSGVQATKVTLNWADNSSNETSFILERRNATAGEDYTLVANLTANEVTFTDTNLLPGTLYNYRLSAKNATTQSSFAYLSTSLTTLPAPVLTPSGINVAQIQSNQATINWTDNSNNETEFIIDRRSVTDGGDYAFLQSIAANNTSFIDKTLSPNKEYLYRLSCKNGSSVSHFAYSAIFKTTETAGTGLQATYYNNIDFTGASAFRIDPSINFNWGNGSPLAAIEADTFSVRWTGQIRPSYSETYTFYTTTDDGVRLWVNDVQLINKWNIQGSTEHTATITLNAGQKYNIKVEYFDNAGGATSKLSWSSKSLGKEIIPQSALYQSSAITAKNTNDIKTTASEILDNSVTTYPNPAKSVIYIKVDALDEKAITVELVSSVSKTVKKETFTTAKGSNVFTLNINGLEAGLYFLKLYDGPQIIVKKVIVGQ